MILYLDTGSLLRRCAHDRVSLALDESVRRADVTATSQVSLTEATAAVRAAPRWSGSKLKDLRRALAALEADWPDYLVIGIDERLASDVAGRHPLDGFGALHIAAALTAVRLAPAAAVAFSTFDRGISWAARSEGLDVVDWDA